MTRKEAMEKIVSLFQEIEHQQDELCLELLEEVINRGLFAKSCREEEINREHGEPV